MATVLPHATLATFWPLVLVSTIAVVSCWTDYILPEEECSAALRRGSYPRCETLDLWRKRSICEVWDDGDKYAIGRVAVLAPMSTLGKCGVAVCAPLAADVYICYEKAGSDCGNEITLHMEAPGGEDWPIVYRSFVNADFRNMTCPFVEMVSFEYCVQRTLNADSIKPSDDSVLGCPAEETLTGLTATQCHEEGCRRGALGANFKTGQCHLKRCFDSIRFGGEYPGYTVYLYEALFPDV